MMAPKAGDRISNYLLEELVGSGSFGQVWRARHHVLDEVVAVKLLTDSQYVRNFRLEGVVVHGLNHPNIVRAIDIDPYADIPYMIMEYVDGPSLRKVIEDHPAGLPIEACVTVLSGVLGALAAADDAGLVHRDVKPANILLRLPDGDLSTLKLEGVKLTDFGLGKAAAITKTSLLQSGSLVTEEGRNIAGTLVYMSPEQRAGAPLDGRSDLFSCGVVLFEMLTGSAPTGGDMPSTIRPEVPPYLEEVFRKAYTRVERRFVSARAMLAALEQGRFKTEGAPKARVIGGAAGYGRVVGAAPRTCPTCNRPVQGDDNFCIHCGQQLVSQVPRCSACRAFVSRSDHYCIFCGEPLQTHTG